MNVLEVVRKQIERQQLLDPEATIVVGVSGGSDSVCLLHILKSLQPEFKWSIRVAHLNHCLRGTDADEDMVFVALLASEWELPCTIEAVDVASMALRLRFSLEETARQVRYGFLSDVARQVNATAVAVGHNADDQSETVLMHFMRGAGLAGLKGMSAGVDLESLRVLRDRPSTLSPGSGVRLVRPLLSVPRTEIANYNRQHHLSTRFDRSNLDLAYVRNRLRHHLLPLLETYNPNIKEQLRRTAAIASADHALIAAARDSAWADTVVEENQTAVSFDLAKWRALPLALQRATLRQAAYRLRPDSREVEFVHIQQAVEIAASGSTGAIAGLPQGLRMTVGYQTLRLALLDRSPPAPNWALLWQDEPIPVAVPGQTIVPVGASPTKWWLEARLWEGERDTVLSNSDRWTAYFDVDRLGTRLALRRRRTGDRFQPLGLGGKTTQVSDFMINAKIPHPWREQIALLVHNRGDDAGAEQIAWIVGWRVDERVKVTARTRQTVRLRWLQSPRLETQQI